MGTCIGRVRDGVIGLDHRKRIPMIHEVMFRALVVLILDHFSYRIPVYLRVAKPNISTLRDIVTFCESSDLQL